MDYINHLINYAKTTEEERQIKYSVIIPRKSDKVFSAYSEYKIEYINDGIAYVKINNSMYGIDITNKDFVVLLNACKDDSIEIILDYGV